MDLNTLILENKNLIYKICSFFPYSNKEDLFQVGCVGLISAYKRYDSSIGTKFTTYAYPFILGEINNYVKKDKGIKISRDVSRLNSSIEKTCILLTQKLMHEPSTKEIADFLEIDESLVVDAFMSRYPIKSFDSAISSDSKDITLFDVIPDINSMDMNTLVALKEELNKLSPFEKELIEARYVKDLTQSEIANNLGMSQVQVSRSEKHVLSKLKKGLCV